ncbi:MerR family transcriptional regulator [Promicromonospora sp. NPDC023987]|uniref:MerR family transcriptional regulator n=1 Tax=Promicromonospora sp. NPDC023987 TaxID=3155360 RepID=UPI0034098FB7
MGTPGTSTTMRIGTVAERTGLSLRTLRHWDEVGLVTPSGRTDGGFRLYTDTDVDRILLVRRMKPLGFSLDEMAGLLDVVHRLAGGETIDPDGADLRARLDEFTTTARARRADLARKLDMADELIALLGAV